MLLLTCHCCGVSGEETEFHPGGEAWIKRSGPESDDDAFSAYLFERRNTRGVHFERWRHIFGCGKWFIVARCTRTLELFGTCSAQTSAPPPELLSAIRARRPDWEMPQ